MIQRSATEARRVFFQLLDAAQRGEDVRVTRNGVSFRLVVADREAEAGGEAASPFSAIDPAVLSGDWRWAADESGELQFEAGVAPADRP